MCVPQHAHIKQKNYLSKAARKPFLLWRKVTKNCKLSAGGSEAVCGDLGPSVVKVEALLFCVWDGAIRPGPTCVPLADLLKLAGICLVGRVTVEISPMRGCGTALTAGSDVYKQAEPASRWWHSRDSGEEAQQETVTRQPSCAWQEDVCMTTRREHCKEPHSSCLST